MKIGNLYNYDEFVSAPPEPTRRNYTVDEISAILDGMDNNKRYNYQGLEASPGDQYLDRGYLTKRLVDAVLPNYNIQDVQNMLYGMQNGSLYNYRGRIASPGERTWLKDQLELLLIFLLGLRTYLLYLRNILFTMNIFGSLLNSYCKSNKMRESFIIQSSFFSVLQ
jgi:hypothetical protein